MELFGSAPFLLSEWAMQESNLRLPPCEDGTLAAELIALDECRFTVIGEALQLFNYVRCDA